MGYMEVGDFVLMEEDVNLAAEISAAEVEEYARWLGMDLESYPDLFWIAREGLVKPLPAPWKACQARQTGDLFFFNFETGESSWDHPCDEGQRRCYKEEKLKKEAPKKIVTISQLIVSDAALSIVFKSAFSGIDIATWTGCHMDGFQTLWCALAEQLEVPDWSLRILLSDGRLLDAAANLTTVAELVEMTDVMATCASGLAANVEK